MSDQPMPLLSAADRRLLEAVSNLMYSNPFLPEILTYEREALGSDFTDDGPIWSMAVNDPDRVRANTWRIMHKLARLLKQLRERLVKRVQASERDLLLYEDALLYYLYYQYYPRMLAATFNYQGTAKLRWAFTASSGRSGRIDSIFQEPRCLRVISRRILSPVITRLYVHFIIFLNRSSARPSRLRGSVRLSGNQCLPTISGDTGDPCSRG